MIVREPRPSDALVQIHAAALDDGRLSFKARGILAYLLARPAGDSTTAERLARHGTDGERAVKSGLRELEEHGYLVRDGDTVTVTDAPGVATPTPQPAVSHPPVHVEPMERPADAPKGWMPSEQAMKTARDNIELMDVDLYITHYRIRCVERGTQPQAGEWLRWLVQEEEKLRIKQKEDAKANGQHKKWFAVAGD